MGQQPGANIILSPLMEVKLLLTSDWKNHLSMEKVIIK